jgi:hypothetical protein
LSKLLQYITEVALSLIAGNISLFKNDSARIGFFFILLVSFLVGINLLHKSSIHLTQPTGAVASARRFCFSHGLGATPVERSQPYQGLRQKSVFTVGKIAKATDRCRWSTTPCADDAHPCYLELYSRARTRKQERLSTQAN